MYNCEGCPYNIGQKEGAARIAGPCGQQNCWLEWADICAAREKEAQELEILQADFERWLEIHMEEDDMEVFSSSGEPADLWDISRAGNPPGIQELETFLTKGWIPAPPGFQEGAILQVVSKNSPPEEDIEAAFEQAAIEEVGKEVGLWADFLRERFQCSPDEQGNMPCDNGCLCCRCMTDAACDDWVAYVKAHK